MAEQKEELTIEKGPAKSIINSDPVSPAFQFQETSDVRNQSDFPSQVNEWIGAASAGSGGFVATLYKYDKLHKQKQAIIYEDDNAILSANDVGLMFGSGSYRYMFWIRDSKVPPKAVIFNIGEEYDARRIAEGLAKDPHAGNNGKGSISESLELFKSFAEIMKSVMPPAAAPVPANPDVSAMVRSNYEFMNTIMKQSFKDQSEMYQNIMAKNFQEEEIETEAEPGQGLKDIIMPLLEKLVPVLLGEGPNAKLAETMIKQAPEFQKLLSEKNQLQAVIIEAKKAFGAKKIDTVMKKLGVAV